ncbi:DUF6575 domain-containing protein [Nocardioides sp. NPDC023903]|uniref:DUF6575 domain-containing protein n=1 Tax=Nocardioides sp. NPDC023903 TaxID=3157195 RepID=UPI0033D1C24F
MTLDASAALPFGRLAVDEVFFEHDGPKLFSLRARSLGIRILAVCIDEDEDRDTLTFLYLAMGARRYLDVRSGHIGLREAMEQAERGTVWLVVENYSGPEPILTAEVTDVDHFSDSDLPTSEARLRLPTPTVAPLDLEELDSLAAQGLRTVAAIELEARSESATEFPLRSLGAVGTALQESLDALAQEVQGNTTGRGAISPAITDQVQMSVLGLRAASFAVILGTDKRGAMIDNSPFVEATLNRLTRLVGDGTNTDVLTASLQEYGSRARNKFTALLRAVNGVGSGIGVVTVPHDGGSDRAEMTSRQVATALAAIDSVEPTVDTVHVRRGALIGLNTRLHTFELTDLATMQRFSGKVAQGAYASVDGLHVGQSSFVTADIRMEVDFAADDQETGRRYTLTSIEATSD